MLRIKGNGEISVRESGQKEIRTCRKLLRKNLLLEIEESTKALLPDFKDYSAVSYRDECVDNVHYSLNVSHPAVYIDIKFANLHCMEAKLPKSLLSLKNDLDVVAEKFSSCELQDATLPLEQ